MGQTNIPYGSQLANKVQSAGLFAANTQRNTTLNRLVGKLPQQARGQRHDPQPVVQLLPDRPLHGPDEEGWRRDHFDLINPMGGKPIMGSAMAEGRGRAMSLDQDRLRINQARYPISAGDTMTQQRAPRTSCARWRARWGRRTWTGWPTS